MAFDKTKTIAVNEADFDARLAAVEAKASSGTPTPTPTPSSGMPQQSRLLAHWQAEDIPAQAEDSEVNTWTDRVNGLVARANTNGNGGPRYVQNRHNGLPALHFFQMSMRVDGFAGSAFEAAALASDATIIYVMDDIFGGGCPGGSYQGVGQFDAIANAGSLGAEGTAVPLGDRTFTTLAIGLASNEFIRVNSGAVWQYYGSRRFGGNFTIGDIGGGNRWFGGRITDIIVYQGSLTQAEHIQMEKHLRSKRAIPLPWANNTNYHVFDGDSLTRGQGVTGDNPAQNYPYKMAQKLGLKYGAWTNVGMGGRAYSDKPNNAGQGIDARATAGLDTIPTLVGKPTQLYVFEWYNQNGITNTSTGTINAAKTYLQHRVAAGFKVVFGTSTDFNASQNADSATRRAEYNAYWDTAANRSGLMDKYVPLHIDPNVGVAGSCPTNGSNAYFTGDGIHNADEGYTAIANNFFAAGTTA